MSSDDRGERALAPLDRETILARRRRFAVVALSGVAIANATACACLKVAPRRDPGAPSASSAPAAPDAPPAGSQPPAPGAPPSASSPPPRPRPL